MKIRNQRDVEKLDLRIQQELGIDVKRYRNEEVVEGFVDLLLFPKYVVSWGIRPIIASFVLFVTGFFVLHLVHVEYLIYALIGLVLFLANGVLAGVLFLLWKIKSDIWAVVDCSLEILRSAVVDLYTVNQQIAPENRREVLNLLFQGITHIVTIPVVTKVIVSKIPFIGRLVSWPIARVLTLISNTLDFGNEEPSESFSGEEGEQEEVLLGYNRSITLVSSGLRKVTNFAFGVAQLPFKIVFGLLFSLLLLFLWLIH